MAQLGGRLLRFLFAVVLATSAGCANYIYYPGPGDVGEKFPSDGNGFDVVCLPQDAGPPDDRPVISPATQPPPISGGTLAVLANGTIVAADSDRDRVWIVDPTETSGHAVLLNPGDEPGRVIEGPLGRAFVALRRGGAVAEIDVASQQVIARHDACPAPRGIGWSATRSTLYVACATGAFARLKFDVGATSLTLLLRTVSHPAEDLRDVVIHGEQVLVSTFRSARILQINDDDSVWEQAQEPVTGVFSRRVGWRMVGTPTGALMVHQLERTQQLFNNFCGESSYGGQGVFGVDAGQASLVIATGLSAIGGPAPTSEIGVAPLPVDLAVSATGSWAIVVAGNGEVRANLVGDNPFHWVQPEVTSVAFRGSELITFSREPSAIFILPPEGQATKIPLFGASVASTAHSLFHTATSAHLACASCHPEGREDGHVWQLPEGPRRTNSLLGGLRASAPFHWTGDRPTMNSLMDDVMVQRMGGKPQSTAHNEALLDWLDKLPALPLPDNLDQEAVARGKALFESAELACATCHTGALGTNNQNGNIGTDGFFQVPRLVGLAARAPYLHDGRIATLADRFKPTAGGEQHGHTSQLTSLQKLDLIEYMRSR